MAPNNKNILKSVTSGLPASHVGYIALLHVFERIQKRSIRYLNTVKWLYSVFCRFKKNKNEAWKLAPRLEVPYVQFHATKNDYRIKLKQEPSIKLNRNAKT